MAFDPWSNIGGDILGADMSSYDYSASPMSYDISSAYTQPTNFQNYSGGNFTLPYDVGYSGGNFSFDSSPWASQDIYSSSNFGTTFNPYSNLQYSDGPSGSNAAYLDDLTGWGSLGGGSGSGKDPSMLGSLWDKFSGMPLDKQVGLGMGVLNGLGSFMAAKQTNKNNKKAAKIMAQEAAMRRKMQEAQLKTSAIAHSWSDSVDPVAQAQTYAYNPLTAEQTAHYGETGSPHQQLIPDQMAAYSPNTGRIQLAKGGMASCGTPNCPHCGHEGYSLGGMTGGQDDKIPAMLSDGEYVMDADTVAALGDGNTKAGASALDQMRQEVRKHKRSAPVSKIPPKAKPAAKYLPKKGRK